MLYLRRILEVEVKKGGVLKMGFWNKLTGTAGSKQQDEEVLMAQQEEVKIYTLSTCSHCKATKKFLDSCRIEYSFTDVDLLAGAEREAILEEVRRFNPRCTFPTIIIGDKVIVGFKEDEIKEALHL
jgi:glutaredoxin-like protein NrdH